MHRQGCFHRCRITSRAARYQAFCKNLIVAWFALIGACAYAASDQRGQLSRALLENLEQRFERADIQDWGAVTGLVVLGGKATRVEEAVRLASAYPHLKLVLSGPGENEQALALTAKGVDPSRVTVEKASRNTYGNAYFSKRVIGSKPGERWLLVTSASHMPRAIGSFYQLGLHVDPWPVYEKTQPLWELTHVGQYEALGLLSYWVTGRTIALYPGQADLRRYTAKTARALPPLGEDKVSGISSDAARGVTLRAGTDGMLSPPGELQSTIAGSAETN